ncbi:hypothetical protein FH972_025048 [Carpinus fangiana]|uniref:Polynucleotide adenylyltransferase n=1 Tax=Carpinus fangiana TaxID=176857 RepID=A0A5N6KZW5_9ROSI|nr:hypothetical protein FH972_025048 [Carpinus fangiana]
MDSYRPGRDAPARPAYQFGRDNRQHGGGDSYRPVGFAFRAQSHNTPNFNDQPHPERNYNRGRPPQNRRQGPQSGNDNRSAEGRRPPPNRRRPFQPRPKVPVAERPLLRGRQSVTPEQYEGMNGGPARFKDLTELPEAGDSADSSVDGISQEPPYKKMATASSARADGTSVPKWSNPDPYTALPPPEESTGVRTDVVELIRKARSDAAKEKLSAGDGEDFISFDLDNGEPSSESESNHELSVVAPRGPKSQERFSHLDRLHPNRFAPGTDSISYSADVVGPPPPPPPELETTSQGLKAAKSALNGAPIDVWPPPPPPPTEPKTQSKLSRKRGHDLVVDQFDINDDMRNGAKPRPKRKFVTPGFELDSKWLARPSENATPWCTVDHSDTESVGHILHKEICDFYDYLKPRRCEIDVRQDLIRRTTRAVRSIFESSADLCSFGSFAAGVYLPNADMDLVILSRDFRERRIRTYGSKKALYRFAGAIRHGSDYLAKPGSVATIPNAKVPIVKYVDALTGIRVDVSFDNDTGVVANNTYVQWTAQYPAMPILVTLVKQFLQMRSLNDVSVGGLGGFSTTCLVVSLLQHLPQVQSDPMSQATNLGELFMSFLDFYGNKFDVKTTGIQLNPPLYFAKVNCVSDKGIRVANKGQAKNFTLRQKSKPFALCVVDPNRENNDLTVGTRHCMMIFECFAHAFSVVQERMAEMQSGDKSQRKGSILSGLFAGSYTSIEYQRTQLERLWASSPGTLGAPIAEHLPHPTLALLLSMISQQEGQQA